MKKNLNQVTVCILVCIFAFLVFICSLWCPNIIKSVQNSILTLTLFVILWYSFEANKLNKNIQKQIYLGISPCIIIYYNEAQQVYVVKNVGNGTAINVRIEPFKIDEVPGKYTFSCLPLHYVEKNQSYNSNIIQMGGKVLPNQILPSTQKIVVKVVFENIERENFCRNVKIF
jgi:hypothetical protein